LGLSEFPFSLPSFRFLGFFHSASKKEVAVFCRSTERRIPKRDAKKKGCRLTLFAATKSTENIHRSFSFLFFFVYRFAASVIHNLLILQIYTHPMKIKSNISVVFLCMSMVTFAANAQKVVSPGVDALGKALSNPKEGEIIFLKNGTYKRIQALLEVTKKNITIIGESRDGVVITGNRYSGQTVKGSQLSTADTHTLLVSGDGFYAENLTIENTATQAQAVALRSDGDSMIFNNCRLLGYQDTHYARMRKRQYFVNCEVRGDVDFIFGDAMAMYENSRIISRSRKGGYIAAPADNGKLIFKNCTLAAEEGLAPSSCYLGRPWGETNTTVAYIGCTVGNHIKPEGWQAWNNPTPNFYEYSSVNPDGASANVSQRVLSRQLSETEAASYNPSTFFGSWNPLAKAQSPLLAAPAVHIVGDSLRWNIVEGARGYLIFRNDSLLDYSTKPAYSIKGKLCEKYCVKTVNRYGRVGEASDMATSISSHHIIPSHKVYVLNSILYAPKNEQFEMYNIVGGRVISCTSAQQISLSGLPKGIYITRILLDKKGTVATQKIIVR
jgi:pectinesterase